MSQTDLIMLDILCHSPALGEPDAKSGAINGGADNGISAILVVVDSLTPDFASKSSTPRGRQASVCQWCSYRYRHASATV